MSIRNPHSTLFKRAVRFLLVPVIGTACVELQMNPLRRLYPNGCNVPQSKGLGLAIWIEIKLERLAIPILFFYNINIASCLP